MITVKFFYDESNTDVEWLRQAVLSSTPFFYSVRVEFNPGHPMETLMEVLKDRESGVLVEPSNPMSMEPPPSVEDVVTVTVDYEWHDIEDRVVTAALPVGARVVIVKYKLAGEGCGYFMQTCVGGHVGGGQFVMTEVDDTEVMGIPPAPEDDGKDHWFWRRA